MLNDNCVQNVQVHETYRSVLYNTKVIYRFEEKPQQTNLLIANHRARKFCLFLLFFNQSFLFQGFVVTFSMQLQSAFYLVFGTRLFNV